METVQLKNLFFRNFCFLSATMQIISGMLQYSHIKSTTQTLLQSDLVLYKIKKNYFLSLKQTITLPIPVYVLNVSVIKAVIKKNSHLEKMKIYKVFMEDVSFGYLKNNNFCCCFILFYFISYKFILSNFTEWYSKIKVKGYICIAFKRILECISTFQFTKLNSLFLFIRN